MMLPRIGCLARVTRLAPSSAATTTSNAAMDSPQGAPPARSTKTVDEVAPPRRRHRDAVSVLRALASCVTPHLGLPAYGCALEPWLGPPGSRERSNRLAAAAGRNAARYVARNLLANDLAALATEVPRIDSLMPLQTAGSIRKELSEGKISQQEAMDRLLLLLAPKDAWHLYKDAQDAKWDSNTLHRLLDLLCATNNGFGGPNFLENLPFVDRGSLPEPEELFYAAENRIANVRRFFEIPDKPTISLEGFEAAEAGSAENTGDELVKSGLEEEEVLSTETSSWHQACPAEQLWAAHNDVLRSPAAYASVICGAARFGAADRAWELAEEAVAASSRPLPLLAYNSLLRCAHECSSSGDDVWPQLSRGFELLRSARLAPNALTFSSALYSLAMANINLLRKNGQPQGYADKALGLLVEARRLNIQPTLGLYNNLLRTVLTSRHPNSSKGYRMTELLADVLADLESRCLEGLSRADIFDNVDDYEFVTTAMLCAIVDSPNPSALLQVQQIYDFVHTRFGDRRFLFRNSLEARKFYSHYLTTKIRHGGGGVQELRELYRDHRQVVHGNQRVYVLLLDRLKDVVVRWNAAFVSLQAGKTQKREESVNSAKLQSWESSASLAFEMLGEMVFDFVALNPRLPQRLPLYISETLRIFSLVDPWVEVSVPWLQGRPALRGISEAGCRSAHRAALAFTELLRAQAARAGASASESSTPFASPLSTPEVTALVRMALHLAAFNTGVDGQQTVTQRETNHRALACVDSLLLLLLVPLSQAPSTGKSCVSDVAAVEILRASWLTSPGVISERIWQLLEYLAKLEHLGGRCVQHAFVEDGSLQRLLDAAEASLSVGSASHSRGVGRSPPPPRLQVVRAVREKFANHFTASTPPIG